MTKDQRYIRHVGGAVLLGLLTAGLPTGALGQDKPPIKITAREARALTVSGGIAPYDLAGTGTAAVFGIGVDLPVTSFLLVEPGVRYLRYESQTGSHESFLLPEMGLNLQIPNRWVRPYVVVGGGIAAPLEGRSETDLTLNAGLGARIRFGLRPEVRVRCFETSCTGTTSDLTLGLVYGF